MRVCVCMYVCISYISYVCLYVYLMCMCVCGVQYRSHFDVCVLTTRIYRFQDTEDLSDIRIGIFDDWFNDADKEVVKACREAVDLLVQRGATVVRITIPHLQWMGLAHGIKISSEFALAFDKQFHQNWDDLETNTRITVGVGKTVSALEVLAAEKLRSWGFNYVRHLFQNHSLTAIINPTIGMLPPSLTEVAKVYGESNSPMVVQLMKYIM